MNIKEIEDSVSKFIRDELGGDVKDENQDLLKEAIIDSFNMIQLIQFIEETFQLSIDIEDLELDSFKSVNSIAHKVLEWKSA